MWTEGIWVSTVVALLAHAPVAASDPSSAALTLDRALEESTLPPAPLDSEVGITSLAQPDPMTPHFGTWIYQLVVVTDQGTFMSAAMELLPEMSADFSAALGGVAGTISSAYFVVSGVVPDPDGNRTADYQISPAAQPLTLTVSDIAGFSMLSSFDPATVTINNGIIPDATAVRLTTVLAPPQTGLQGASVGLAGLNIAFNGGDAFKLHMLNSFTEDANFLAVTGPAAGGASNVRRLSGE